MLIYIPVLGLEQWQSLFFEWGRQMMAKTIGVGA